MQARTASALCLTWCADPARQLSYRFALGAPACSDDPACECPRLERRAGDVVTALALARRCD